LARWFSDLPVINHGFGGSYVSDSVFFFNELVTPVKPRQIVMYAGGNDIAVGKTPEQVRDDFLKFASIVRHDLPDARLTYIATAPNPKRWPLIDKTRAANRLIREAIDAMQSPTVEFVEIEDKLLDAAGQPQPRLYVEDQLHLSDAGYKILTAAVRPYLQ
jgi:lysophospholipase L1-like esterase